MWLCLCTLLIISSIFVVAHRQDSYVEHHIDFVKDETLEHSIKRLDHLFQKFVIIADKSDTTTRRLLTRICRIQKTMNYPVGREFESLLTGNEYGFFRSTYQSMKRLQNDQRNVFNNPGTYHGNLRTRNAFKQRYTNTFRTTDVFKELHRHLSDKQILRETLFDPFAIYMTGESRNEDAKNNAKKRCTFLRGIIEIITKITSFKLMMAIIDRDTQTDALEPKLYDIIVVTSELFDLFLHVVMELKTRVLVLSRYHENRECVVGSSVIYLLADKYPKHNFGLIMNGNPFQSGSPNPEIKSIWCEDDTLYLRSADQNIVRKKVSAPAVEMDKISAKIFRELSRTYSNLTGVTSQLSSNTSKNEICEHSMLAYILPQKLSQCTRTTGHIKVAKHSFNVNQCEDSDCTSRPYNLYLIG